MAMLMTILVLLVAAEHMYFLYLEMFQWTTPKGLTAFGNTPEKAEVTRVLAANQGLYNGFLAAGLIFGLVYPDAGAAAHIRMFFLACIIVAGIYGGLTAKRTILYIQGGPALLALVLHLMR